jgi:DNA primase
MQFSQEFITQLKDRIHLSEIFAKSVKLIPAGPLRYKALCPFHNEKTPSFVISDERKQYHCFGCGAHGDVLSYLQEKEGYAFADAIKYLASIAGMALPKENAKEGRVREELSLLEEIAKFFESHLRKNRKIHNYLKNRGLDGKIAKEFNIGFAPDTRGMLSYVAENKLPMKKLKEFGVFKENKNGELYFLFQERIMFPIHNQSGKVVAFGGRITGEGQPKYLNSPEHKFFKKREILYNFHRAKNHIGKLKNAIICEGYMDVIALASHGFLNVVAPLGTAFSEDHLQLLWRYCNIPTICLDGDEAGQKAMYRIIDIALPHLIAGKSLNFVILPAGQDPDDVLKMENGKRILQNLFANPYSLSQLILRKYLKKQNNNAEKRSEILAEFKEISEKIKDKQVASQYLSVFKDNFYKFFNSRKSNNTNILSSNLSLNTTHAKSKEAIDLLVFVILNNEILEDEAIEEEFSMLEFTNSNLTKLQTYILEKKEKIKLEKLIVWLEKNIENSLVLIIKKHFKSHDIIESQPDEDKDNNAKWKYLSMHYNLSKLKLDYQQYWQSGEPEKQELAIALKDDIRSIQEDLNDLLVL